MSIHQDINKLASDLGQALLLRQWKVATAESCTGGGVAEAITEVAGSSQWFELGLVTYSNQMKSRYLGVDEQILEQHGAVSEVTVAAMLSGLLSCSGADLGISISGIAGPTGAVPGKPIGTVCFAWGFQRQSKTATEQFAGNRQAVRQQAIVYALNSLLLFVKNTV